MSQPNVLLLDFSQDDDLGRELRAVFAHARAQPPHEMVLAVRTLELAALSPSRQLLADHRYDVVLLALPQRLLAEVADFLRTLNQTPGCPPLIVATEGGAPDALFALLEVGVADFVTPPLKPYEVLPRLWRLLEQKRRNDVWLRTLKAQLGLQRLVGESRPFQEAVRKIPRLAQCDASVLIAGETGTGKEMCARAIHYLSPRAHHPFVAVNCGALPVELVENELFGHERGAFTDAHRAQPGVIREADGGSLFLDEVDALLPAAQVKLLRFLQEGEFRPLGAAKALRANVRVIAATNTDLTAAVRTGKLRQDLFYRLNVLTLALPPLRERRDDIPLLAQHFLAKHAAMLKSVAADFSEAALQRLMRYAWPGNVRELENLITRAAALAERAVIDVGDLELPADTALPPAASLREAKSRFERGYIEDLLRLHHGNITRAARAARKDRRSFWELIRKHKIDAAYFKSERPAD